MKKYATSLGVPALLLLFIAVGIFAGGWINVNPDVPPNIRSIISEERGIIDGRTHGSYVDDFLYMNTTLWDTTAVVTSTGGTTAAILDSLSALGILKISFPAMKGEGMNIQTENASVKVIRASKPDSAAVETEYEVRFKPTNATQYTLIAGLCSNDTNLYGGQANGIYFIKHDNSTTLYGKEIKTNAALADTVSLGTTSNATWYKLRLVWNGASVYYYVNDVYKGKATTAANQPIEKNLMPSFEVICGDSTADHTYLDYMRVRQRR